HVVERRADGVVGEVENRFALRRKPRRTYQRFGVEPRVRSESDLERTVEAKGADLSLERIEGLGEVIACVDGLADGRDVLARAVVDTFAGNRRTCLKDQWEKCERRCSGKRQSDGVSHEGLTFSARRMDETKFAEGDNRTPE